MIHKRVLPGGARVDQTGKQLFNTLAEAYASQGSVKLDGMRLPAFDKNRVVATHQFKVFDADCRLDIILGADFLEKIGMNLRYEDLTIEWLGNTVSMETIAKSTDVAAHVDYYIDELDREELGFDIDESYLSVPILDAKYNKWSIEEVCAHMTKTQQDDMRALLAMARHTKLFDGSLGKYPGEPMHIELIPGAQPVYRNRRPYPVPQVHMQAFKKELDHLVEI